MEDQDNTCQTPLPSVAHDHIMSTKVIKQHLSVYPLICDNYLIFHVLI
jgi:hypothetical protein